MQIQTRVKPPCNYRKALVVFVDLFIYLFPFSGVFKGSSKAWIHNSPWRCRALPAEPSGSSGDTRALGAQCPSLKTSVGTGAVLPQPQPQAAPP